MTAPRHVDRLLRAFLDEGQTELADRAFDAVRRDIHGTRQRVVVGPLTEPSVTNLIRVAAAAAFVLALGVGWINFGPTGGNSGRLPIPLASGRFTVPIGAGTATFVLEASGSGTNVSGVLDVLGLVRLRPTEPVSDYGRFSVDLQCASTTENGILLIGGDVSSSTHDEIAVGKRVAIALRPGTPTKVILWFEDQPRAANCAAFLEGVPDDVAIYLQPVVGDVRFGP